MIFATISRNVIFVLYNGYGYATVIFYFDRLMVYCYATYFRN